MGLDAFVPCRCIHDGKHRTPPPVPIVWNDAEGGWEPQRTPGTDPADRDRSFEEEIAVGEWARDACEHEDGDIDGDRIGNWSLVAHLRQWLIHVGRNRAPLLTSEFIGVSNGGHVTADDCTRMRQEIDRLRAPDVAVPTVVRLSGSGHPVGGMYAHVLPWNPRVHGGDVQTGTWFEHAPDGSPVARVCRTDEPLDDDAVRRGCRPEPFEVTWSSDHFLVVPTTNQSDDDQWRVRPCQLIDVPTAAAVDLSFSPYLSSGSRDTDTVAVDPSFDFGPHDGWLAREYVLRPSMLTFDQDCGFVLDILARLADAGAATGLGLYWC